MIRLTVRQLQYFEALAETLHFGRAAAACGISQPALSSQIAEMEQALGRRLFERGNRTARLTEEALTLKPRIEAILSGLREVEALAEQGPAAMDGVFRLGLIPTVAPYLLPVALPHLKRRYPLLRLELREAVTATLVDETIGGRLDAMIAAAPLAAPGLAVEELFSEAFLFCEPATDPEAPFSPVPAALIATDRLMLLEEGHCLRDQALSACGAERGERPSTYAATSLTTLLHMVAHGLGTTLIPEMARRSAEGMPGVRLTPLAEPAPGRSLALARRKGSHRGAECRALAESVREARP